jgi:hypothetical protein
MAIAPHRVLRYPSLSAQKLVQQMSTQTKVSRMARDEAHAALYYIPSSPFFVAFAHSAFSDLVMCFAFCSGCAHGLCTMAV